MVMPVSMPSTRIEMNESKLRSAPAEMARGVIVWVIESSTEAKMTDAGG
jgi:hypothetical protein